MKRKETIREFINKRSSGAFVTFEFDVDQVSSTSFKEYSCISVEDFLFEYGRKSSYILDDYVVVDTKESEPSNDQGQTIQMKVQKKSELTETLKPIELTASEVEDILNNLYSARELLNKDYNIITAMRYVEYVINSIEEKGE